MSDALIAYLPLEEKITSVHAVTTDVRLYVVVGTRGGEVWLWSLKRKPTTTTCIELEALDTHLLHKHTDEVTAVSFNVAGTKVASVSLDSFVHVCDVATGMTLFRKQHEAPLTCLNWSFFSELLLVADECGSLFVWNMQTGTIQLQRDTLFGDGGMISGLTVATAMNNNRMVIVAGVRGREFSIVALECVFAK